MKHFKCSLSMCYPHKVWVKEWQIYHNKTHNSVKCKEKFRFERMFEPVSYVYDDTLVHRSMVCKNPRPDALTVSGWRAWHVCVDGGLIRFGYHNTFPGFNCSRRRCDSLVFDRCDLWFVEFKMNTTTALDDQKWKDLKDGMLQLRDFIKDLRSKMAAKRTPLEHYFKVGHQHCTICMDDYPMMNPSRQNHLEHFRLDTGIKLQQQLIISKPF